MNYKKELDRIKNLVSENVKDKQVYSVFIAVALMGILYLFSQYEDHQASVHHKKTSIDFSGGSVIGNVGKSVYERKEKVFSNKFKNIDKTFKKIDKKFEGIQGSLEEIKDTLKTKAQRQERQQQKEDSQSQSAPTDSQVNFSSSPNGLRPGQISLGSVNSMKNLGSTQKSRKYGKGPSIISFPVKEKREPKVMGVKLPAGSFVKAKLLTGVEASNKPLPVLLQTDYAFVGPNKSRIDLTGCFLIAKSTGNLSIERVEMQSTKISCVSKSGRMFEKPMNGFVADAKDNSFAVVGSVNSKQGRVASMAFLSSVVEGVGNAIQQAQTTQQANALGGTSSMITGDQGKYIAAGGVGNAASQVTQWYLKHAQNLLPTINVGSGQDVWIVTQDTVELPNWYFKGHKSKSKSGDFKYLSRFLEN